MKTTPFEYFGRSQYATSRLVSFLKFLEEATGKQENDFLFVDPYSIGDCVQSMGLLPAFRRVYCQEGQRIIFLCQLRAQKLVNVMPYADVCIGMDLGAHELALEYAASVSNLLTPSLPIVCPADMHAQGKVVRVGAPPLNMKKAIFFLSQGEAHTPPVVSDELRQATNARLQAAGMQPGGSVIFFPHGLTFHDFGPEFWGAVAAEIKQRRPDASLWTDATTGNAPIEGTLPLSLSLEDVIPAVEYAGSGVFLRSGLVDLCGWANANVFAIVPPKTLYRFMPQGVAPESVYLKAFFPETTVTDLHIPNTDASEVQRLASMVVERMGGQ